MMLFSENLTCGSFFQHAAFYPLRNYGVFRNSKINPTEASTASDKSNGTVWGRIVRSLFKRIPNKKNIQSSINGDNQQCSPDCSLALTSSRQCCQARVIVYLIMSSPRGFLHIGGGIRQAPGDKSLTREWTDSSKSSLEISLTLKSFNWSKISKPGWVGFRYVCM